MERVDICRRPRNPVRLTANADQPGTDHLAGALDALATLAREVDPNALDGTGWRELLGALGLTGIEVRGQADGRLLWSNGSGRAGAPERQGGLLIAAAGGRPANGPLWRAVVELLAMALAGRCRRAESPSPEGIDGRSQAAIELRASVRRLAPTDLTVLLLGETGTGKEVVARALHRLSGRNGSFVPVNAAAVPRELLEAELFGVIRGAFTGAERARAGLVRAADGGTLFLDEIGDLDVGMQTKLLRVLESGEVRPLGSTTFFEVQARVVAATHRDLGGLLERGAFRADLYYRLAQAVVRVPPLRQRREDIPLLQACFEQEAARRLGIPRCRFSAAASSALQRHHWPGNIRELRHVVERAMVEASGGVVTRAMLPLPDDRHLHPRRWDAATASFRRSLLAEALQRNGGNRSATARELGISRQTLHYHLRSLGLTG